MNTGVSGVDDLTTELPKIHARAKNLFQPTSGIHKLSAEDDSQNCKKKIRLFLMPSLEIRNFFFMFIHNYLY